MVIPPSGRSDRAGDARGGPGGRRGPSAGRDPGRSRGPDVRRRRRSLARRRRHVYGQSVAVAAEHLAGGDVHVDVDVVVEADLPGHGAVLLVQGDVVEGAAGLVQGGADRVGEGDLGGVEGGAGGVVEVVAVVGAAYRGAARVDVGVDLAGV